MMVRPCILCRNRLLGDDRRCRTTPSICGNLRRLIHVLYSSGKSLRTAVILRHISVASVFAARHCHVDRDRTMPGSCLDKYPVVPAEIFLCITNRRLLMSSTSNSTHERIP